MRVGKSTNSKKNMKNISESSKLGSTEDDTFRILARPNIDKMVVLHREWVAEHRKSNGTYDQQQNIQFAKYYGWTWITFLKAKKEAGYSS